VWKLGRFDDDEEYHDSDEGEQPFSPIAAAVQEAAHRKAEENEPYEVVLREVRRQITEQRLFSPAQMENPTAQDLKDAEALVRKVVDGYQQTAHVRGLPPLDDEERAVKMVLDEIFGWGPISPYMQDPTVEEIIINGPHSIFVIDESGKHPVPARFRTAAQLINFVNRAAAPRGRKIDRKHPELNVKLRDGSRLHAIMEPLTDNVPIAVTIRRHRLVARTLDDLIRLGTLTEQVAEFLRWCVRGRLNVVISGGTASGKTNFINALCAEIDPDERVITVEDTQELQLVTIRDWVALVTREASEGVRPITQEELIRNTLRMRPDRIITGEARGPEIVPILEAANTGHDGQMLTVHANSPAHVIQRMETMYLKGREVPLRVIRQEIADAFQVIVHLKRVEIPGSGGKRQIRRIVTGVSEITGRMEGDVPEVVPIFEDKGNGLSWTGIYPKHMETIRERSGMACNFRQIVS